MAARLRSLVIVGVTLLAVHGPCPATIIQRLKNESASYSPHTCADTDWALANYADISGQIISLGGWREVVVFTDSPVDVLCALPGSPLQTAVLGCTAEVSNILAAFTGDLPLGDFWNVWLTCERSRSERILLILLQSELFRAWRFNVLVNATVEILQSTRGWFRDGDNMVIVDVTHENQQMTPLWSSDIYWCYGDCFQPDSLRHIPLDPRNPRVPEDLLPARVTDLKGRNLTITYVIYRPFCFTKVVNGVETVLGIEVEIIDLMAKHLNFSYTFEYPPSGLWGSLTPNGSWDGMVGMVVRKDASVGIAGISVTPSRNKVIDYLFPHWEMTSVVVYKLAHHKWYYFMDAFSSKLWVYVLTFPLVVACVLTAATFINSAIRHCTRNESRIAVFTGWLFASYGCLCYQGASKLNQYSSCRVIFATFWLTIIVIVAIYSGNMTATLAVTKVNKPFDSLAGLAEDDNYVFQLTQSTFMVELFKHAKQGSYARIWEKMMRNPEQSFVPSIKVSMPRVLMGGYTQTGDKVGIQEWVRSKSYCNLVYLDEEYFRSGIAMIVPEGWPYKALFDNVILRVLQSGTIEYWDRRYATPDPCNHEGTQPSSTAISLHDISLMVALVLGAGLTAATVAFVMESAQKYASWPSKYINCSKIFTAFGERRDSSRTLIK